MIGLILNGGRSSRMGQDKATLSLHGETLLQRTQRMLALAGAAEVRVSGPDDIPDTTPGQGPLGALASALAALGDVDLLVVPVDMPLLSANDLRLLSAGARTPKRAAGSPLPAYFPAGSLSLDTLQNLLAEPEARDRSLRALHDILFTHEVRLPALSLKNVNTPEDWAAVCELMKGVFHG